MKKYYLLACMIFFPLLSGISGCDSRLEYVVLEYEADSCLQPTFVLPEQIKNGEWELKKTQPRIKCSGFDYYLMTDDKFRSGGGFGKYPTAVGLYIKIKRDTPCNMIAVLDFDRIANPNFQERIKFQSQIAVTTISKQLGIAVHLAEKKIDIIKNSSDIEKWCQPK